VALARGPVIAVAPVAAAGAALSGAIGVLGGDPLSAPIVAGFACALCGSFAAAYQPTANESSDRASSAVLPAIGAAVAIGTFLTLVDAASEADPYWATGGIHVAGWLSAVGLLALRGPRSGSIGDLKPRTWLALAAIGVCGVIADGAFATASQMGDLSVVSVLSSLYPVVTMLLAFALLCERVRGVQLAGAALALTGIVLLASATR